MKSPQPEELPGPSRSTKCLSYSARYSSSEHIFVEGEYVLVENEGSHREN